MKKQMPPANRYYSLLQVLSFLENQVLFRDKFLYGGYRRQSQQDAGFASETGM